MDERIAKAFAGIERRDRISCWIARVQAVLAFLVLIAIIAIIGLEVNR